MTRCLLVHVPASFEEAYPLGLAALAGSFGPTDGVHLEGLDVGRVGLDGLSTRLKRGDIDVVGLSVWSPARDASQAVIARVRAAPSHPALILGGPHPTLEPDDLDADAVVLGEGEESFRAAVLALAAGEPLDFVPGLYLPKQGPTDRRAPADLAALALPDRRVFAVSDYHRDHLPRGRRYAASVTSRGCVYRCTYCSAPKLWGRGHRYRPAEQVQAEWARLKTDHRVDGILVEDDLFTQRPARVEALCEALLRHPPGVTWELLNGLRPETLSPKLLRLMARAGLTRLALSLECADPVALRAMGRCADLQRVRQTVRDAQQAGIGVTGYFLIGLPGEVAADRARTWRFAVSLGLDMAHFSVASAWPGTAWTEAELSHVPPAERGFYYAAWYLEPTRARRAARLLGASPKDLPGLGGRLVRWIRQPLEARRSNR